MTIWFWSLVGVMLLAALAFIALPLKTRKPLFAAPLGLVALFVPLATLGLYALLGSPAAVTAKPAGEKHQAVAVAPGSPGPVASLVDGLHARLQQEPDDAGGWLLLAQSYEHLGRHAEAVAAYARAQALGKSSVDLEARLFGPGIAAATEVRASGPALRGRVSLAPESAAQVRPEDTVFIFAKESRQHRMPVVAVRRPATDLPVDFVLTDREIMVPGKQLSDYQQLVVTAKISRSGNAADASAGLEAWSEPVSPVDAGRIDLLIAPASPASGTDDE